MTGGNIELTRFDTAQELACGAARRFLAFANSESCPRLHVALAGGRIAGRFFSAVAGPPRPEKRALDRIHFFWGDERCVPPEHPESNYGLARDRLFLPLGIPEDRVHRIRGELSPARAADEAAAELWRVGVPRQAEQPVLDLIILGMGEDGHVASLFPNEPMEMMADPAVFRPVVAPKPPPARVTIGYPAIAAARRIWVLASGPGKQTALKESLTKSASTPLGRLLDVCSRVQIFTDLLPAN